MPSILPNFEYDIFISYRHKDNRHGGITEFVELLKKELEATFKEDLSIYFDSNAQDGLLENHHVDKSLEGKLKCLIFIPIISQTYCDTKSFAWQHEFCAFNKLAKADSIGRDVKLSNGNVASRILPIKVHDLDAEDKAAIENEIGGVLRPIEFIYREPGVNRPLKVSDKKEDNQNRTDYANQLNKVANAIKEIITAIKNPAQSTRITNIHQPTTKPKSNKKILIGAAAVLLFALSYFAFQKFYNPSATDGQPEKSIAVLPFVNMSTDKEQEYFSDGLSEELLNLLAKIPDLKVIARTSSFSFKGKNEDLRTIGEKLGVTHILEGSVRKNGNTLRITAQLIKVDDGTHIWSETYDRTLDDIFKLQDEISAAVVDQLKLKLLKTATQPAPMKAEAYNLYLEGRFFTNRSNKESFEKAIEKFKEALAMDPDAALVWAGLSTAYANQAGNGFIPVDDGYRQARQAAEKALQLNPNLGAGYKSLGSMYMNYDWDFVRADEAFKKALELDPTGAGPLANSAILLLHLGKLDESIELSKKAIAADPLRAGIYSNLSITYYFKGELDKAEAAIRKTLDMAPGFGGAYNRLSCIQLAQGKYEAALQSILKENEDGWLLEGLPLVYYKLNRKVEAEKALDNLIQKHGDGSACQIAETYAYLDEKDKAFEWLEIAYKQRDGGMVQMLGDPLLRTLHSDARWLPFLQKMRLADYWPEYKKKYLDK